MNEQDARTVARILRGEAFKPGNEWLVKLRSTTQGLVVISETTISEYVGSAFAKGGKPVQEIKLGF